MVTIIRAVANEDAVGLRGTVILGRGSGASRVNAGRTYVEPTCAVTAATDAPEDPGRKGRVRTAIIRRRPLLVIKGHPSRGDEDRAGVTVTAAASRGRGLEERDSEGVRRNRYGVVATTSRRVVAVEAAPAGVAAAEGCGR